MDSQAMFLNCPEFLDSDGAARCGLPAEAARYIIRSTDGPLESARITCPRGHHLNGPTEYLTVPQPPAVAAVSTSLLAPPAIRGSVAQARADTADPLTNQTKEAPMIDRSSPRATIQPNKLFLRTAGACDLDPEHLLEVFGEQRQRFGAVLREFGLEDWAAPTRCSDWSAQDVVRHLCDGDAIGIAAGPDDRTLDVTAGFDPRITPRRWLAASAGESPDATLGRFAATTGELLGACRYRLARGVRFDVFLPYGPMDWTVRLLHRFWDSWLHERDVLLARGAEHLTNGDATAYATAYGVFIAAAVASMFADPVQEKLTLGGDGGGIFEVDSRNGVTLTVRRGNSAGAPAAEVADALAGRSPIAAVLGDLPPSSCTALSHMADFFNTPVGQTPSEAPK